MKKNFTLVLFLSSILFACYGQKMDSCFLSQFEEMQKKVNSYEHSFELLEKKIDDLMWFQRVGDVAFIDKVVITGPPLANPKNISFELNNPLKFYAYVFISKKTDVDKKYPLIVLPHGGVHGNFSTYNTHVVRELLAQGYIIVAPEYRGSNGYGESFWKAIDYGGFEIQDNEASRTYMVENYSFVDENRVGAVGWSHGGLISLMSVFQYPENYRVCFAGVPVSDLIARLDYYDDDYRKLFYADYHIGKTVAEDSTEYRRRSPAWNVEKLETPLMIHTNTNDDDVLVSEVELLINALLKAGKDFEYEIYQDIPGGHSFDRIDPKQSREIRLKIWKFLAKYLDPPAPMKDLKDMEKAAYVVPE
jgi:dipeptidyl aminopeptidase/acylaminoacyl peptidase